GAGRGIANQNRKGSGYLANDTFTTGETDTRVGPDRLCASWQVSSCAAASSCFPGVYPSVVSAPDPSEHDRHPGAYRDATGSDASVGLHGYNGQASFLQASAHGGASPEDGPGIGGGT